MLLMNLKPAYIVSNEDLRTSVAQTPNAKRILTIAGSGDQALFYTLGGAEHIDTFDITINAHAIQDIKTTAIQNLSYPEYIKLLHDLAEHGKFSVITNNPKLFNALPAATQEIIQMPDNILHLLEHTWPDETNIPTPSEYAKLQAKIKKPFNFILSDALDVSKKLTGKYDVINLSNIFDVIDPARTRDIIIPTLLPFLAPHGVIMINEKIIDLSKWRMAQAAEKIKTTPTPKSTPTPIKPDTQYE